MLGRNMRRALVSTEAGLRSRTQLLQSEDAELLDFRPLTGYP